MIVNDPADAAPKSRRSSPPTSGRWSTNDVEALDRFFLDSARRSATAAAKTSTAIEAIRAFRAGRSPAGLARNLERTEITTYGRDFAIAATLFRRDNAPGKIGRQMQTWVRFPEGWRIVAAHVSVIDDPEAK